MIVKKLKASADPSVPDFYSLYRKWMDVALKTGNPYHTMEAKRFARLAEEFGQAIILEDDTLDDF